MFSAKASPTARSSSNSSHIDASILEALNNVQAIIRFKPDGTIEDANENFLAAAGYSLEEIVGKHHRMFCEPKYVQTPEYAQMWSDLASGKTKSGRFKRINKSGEPIWLQAS